MTTVEPVFGQIKHNRRIDRFHTKRQSRRDLRVAISSSDPQPAQARVSRTLKGEPCRRLFT